MSASGGSYTPPGATPATDLTTVESLLNTIITDLAGLDQDDDATALAALQTQLSTLTSQNQTEDDQTQAAINSTLQEIADLAAQNQVEDDQTQAALATLQTAIDSIVTDLTDEEPRSITINTGHVLLAVGATWSPPAGNLQSVTAVSTGATAQAKITADGVAIDYPSGSWTWSVIRDSDLKLDLVAEIEAVGAPVIVRWSIEA